MKIKTQRIICMVMIFCLFVSLLPTGTNALSPTYTVSSSYASSGYYSKLCSVNKTGNYRTDIVNVALSQLGYYEGSTSGDYDGGNSQNYNNYCEYNYWYHNYVSSGMPLGGSSGPWCATFVSWCARQAGVPESILKNSTAAGHEPAYFNINYAAGGSQASDGGGFMGNYYTPKPGDIFYKSDWSHVGIVRYVEGDYFYTIEGNTNNNGSAQGNGVYSLRRKISDCYFGIPNYGTEIPASSDFPTPLISYSVPINGNISVYVSVSTMGGDVYGEIFAEDECTINAVDISENWVHVTYPAGSTTKTGYVYLDQFFPYLSEIGKPYDATMPSTATTYKKQNMTDAFGTIYSGNKIIVVGQYGDKYQVIYELIQGENIGKYKLGWIDAASSGLPADSDLPQPLIAYSVPAASTISVYASVSTMGGTACGEISAEDECTINSVNISGNWVYVTYPAGDTIKAGYVFLDQFIPCLGGIGKPYNTITTAATKSYKKQDMAEVFGTIYGDSKITVVGKTGNKYQVIYELIQGENIGKYKLGWIDTASSGLPADSDLSVPLIAYGASIGGNIPVYASVSTMGGTACGEISAEDECIINAVDIDKNWVNVIYTVNGSANAGYIYLDQVFPYLSTISQPYETTVTEAVKSYKKQDMTEIFGTIYSGNQITVVGRVADTYQVIYRLTQGENIGKYKLGWIDGSAVAKTPVKIEVTTMPSKMVYLEGETFSAAGMVVTATYDDGTIVDIENYSVSCDFSTAGEKTVKLEYTHNGVSVSTVFTVTVQDAMPYIYSTSMTLDSILQLNISVEWNVLTLEECKLRVTIGDDTETQILTDSLQAKIPAHRLYEPVTIELLYNEQIIDTKIWTMENYSAALRNDHASDSKMMALLDTLSNYGSYTAYYADPTGDAPDTAPVEGIGADTVKAYQYQVTAVASANLKPVASLYLNDAANIRVKFSAAAWGDSKLLINGEEVSVTVGEQYAVYVIEDLIPQQWDDVYHIQVVNAEGKVVYAIDYSVLSYVYAALSSGIELKTGLNNMLKAMYLYNQAAQAYITE